jgi:hypothetical protein
MPTWDVGGASSGSSSVPMAISIWSSPSSCIESGVPQAGQKPRSTTAEERNSPGVPRVQRKMSWGTETSAAPHDPKAFWHIRQ